MNFNKLIVLSGFLIMICFYSCGKVDVKKTDGTPPSKTEITSVDQSSKESDGADTLTKEEFFSQTLVQDIAGDENDDLEGYLEDEIYPVVSKSTKVTLEKISGSFYLLSYDENGKMKSFLIQEFFNPVTEEVFFEKKDYNGDPSRQFIK